MNAGEYIPSHLTRGDMYTELKQLYEKYNQLLSTATIELEQNGISLPDIAVEPLYCAQCKLMYIPEPGTQQGQEPSCSELFCVVLNCTRESCISMLSTCKNCKERYCTYHIQQCSRCYKRMCKHCRSGHQCRKKKKKQ